MKNGNQQGKNEFSITTGILIAQLDAVVDHAKVITTEVRFSQTLNQDMRNFKSDSEEAQTKIIGDNGILKRECPTRPRENAKMWHMLGKLTSLIFRSEIAHDELINVVYFFCSDLLLFPGKFAKTVQDADHFKYGGHKCAEFQHKNFAPEKCKTKFALLPFVYLYGGIDKSFKP